jgi:serine/threonine protein kinase
MNNLNHPNITRLYEVIDSPEKIYLIIEYCEGGPISSILPMSEETASDYFRQLLKVLHYLHEYV